MAIVISAFPACGKTTYCKDWSQDSKENVWRRRNNGNQVLNNLGEPCGERILDSDSSNFSWIKDEDGNNTSERNPHFPNNYIEHIKLNLDKVDIIFVSSHDVVRKALQEHGIDYTLVYPNRDMKEDFRHRYIKRGNDSKFINFIMDNWDKFIDDIESETFPTKYELKPFGNYEYINSTTIGHIIPRFCM